VVATGFLPLGLLLRGDVLIGDRLLVLTVASSEFVKDVNNLGRAEEASLDLGSTSLSFGPGEPDKPSPLNVST
jgi:hypothetical protein